MLFNRISPVTMTPTQWTPFCGLIEPLESRIAPAAVVLLLGPSAQGGVGYSDTHFVNTSTASDAISTVVGPGDVAHPTYYVDLTAGSKVLLFGNSGFAPLIGGATASSGTGGNIVAFFTDKNGDGLATADELTGLALGKNTVVTVSGSVDGDIVSNLNDASSDPTTWKLGGSSAQDLLNNAIAALAVSGDVHGNIIAGGKISNVKVTGKVNGILGGTAGNGVTYDFNSASSADGGDTLAVSAPGTGVAGVSITNTQVGGLGFSTAVGKIQAGNGGGGAAGGSLTKITVLSDTDGLTLLSGNGGDGASGNFAKGGKGGALQTIVINGLSANQADATANSPITIQSGTGGHSAGAVNGGAGGLVKNIFVGFSIDPSTGKLIQSVSSLADTVLVQGGAGGGGKIGGGGAKLTGVHIFSSPTGTGNDIQVIGGNGGASDTVGTGAKAGAGGSLLNVDVRNLNSDLSTPALVGSEDIVHAGAAGATTVAAAGNKGGSIASANILGFMVDVRAGDGSAGSVKGGAGGNLTGITIEDLTDSSAAGIQVHNAVIDAGAGANSSAGKGGIGGNIKTLLINNGDFAGLTINQDGNAANGGTSGSGVGAKGGSVTGLRISGIQSPDLTGTATTFGLRSGTGGDGSTGGGAGGVISDVAVTTPRVAAHNLSLNVHAGNGGSSTGSSGKGGNGGAINAFTANTQLLDNNGAPVFDSSDNQLFNDASATLAAGNGGNGAGTGKGGTGGGITTSHVDTDAGVTLTGGTGGSGGGTGATGSGGSIKFSSDLSNNGAVSLTAGDAGATGIAKLNAGKGGSILTAHIRGLNALTLQAGAGHNGGSGGSVTNSFFSAPDGTASSQNVSVIAGAGSGSGSVAGKGGSVLNTGGFVGLSGTTLIRAGQGGAGTTKAAAGGLVNGVNIYGGGGTSVFNIEAGNATDSTSAKTGGAGGNVTNVRVQQLDDTATLLHIEAGNGGNTGLATGKGGKGGTIDSVFVNHDIGVRAGQGFGANTMGGLFAGSGGTGGAASGVAGNVTNVTADAIAAIVAGRPLTGATITKQNLVTKVDNITLNGAVAPTVNANGSYQNFFTANLIGGNHAADPNSDPGANVFEASKTEFVDNDTSGDFSIGDTTNSSTDGFVAAITLGSNISIFPEALLTLNGSGNSVFNDNPTA